MEKLQQTKSVAVRAGTTIGLLAGIALGFVEGPKGAAIGALLGSLMGFVAGAVQQKENARAAARDRELDAVIGVTKGSLGARPVRMRTGEDGEMEPWGSDWLTAPPPQVG